MTQVESGTQVRMPTSKITRPQIVYTDTTRYKIAHARILHTRISIFASNGKPLFDAAHPLFGPNTAKNLRKLIRKHRDKLREPNGHESAAFIALAYNSQDSNYHEEELTGVRYTASSAYFRVFEGHLYDGTTQKLFIAEPDFNEDGTIKMSAVSELEKRLANGDKRVQVVNFSDLGDRVCPPNTPSELEKSSYIQAVYGKEGAYNLARVADNRPKKIGRVWLPETPSAGQTEIRIAALVSYVGRLGVDGGSVELDWDSCASGVFKNSGEAQVK